MRAIRIHDHGDAGALRVDRIAVPAPGEGQALIRVAAAGVNFIDIYKRKGLYRVPLPATLGEEGAGTVVALGTGASGVSIGERVAWSSVQGSYAEYVAVPAARLVPVPAGVHTSTAAAVLLQGMTAHYLAYATFPLRPGHRCLVHAAAGGVGLLLVQIAKRCGAFVIGTAGTDEKAALARAAGADEVIVYTRTDFAAEVRRITGGKGLDVVYDSVGMTTFLPGFDLLVPRGMMVLYGQSSGPVDAIDPQLLNQKGSVFLTRPSLGHYIATREELLERAGDLFRWIETGELSVRIGAEYELADAAAAQSALEERRTTGKVLLKPA
ncbi:MAG: quinone oxidoreductase [Gemmatimonadetes bacterium]|nr:quinone oxidoreductase [Gemmatimonadota bacterium]